LREKDLFRIHEISTAELQDSFNIQKYHFAVDHFNRSLGSENVVGGETKELPFDVKDCWHGEISNTTSPPNYK